MFSLLVVTILKQLKGIKILKLVLNSLICFLIYFTTNYLTIESKESISIILDTY